MKKDHSQDGHPMPSELAVLEHTAERMQVPTASGQVTWHAWGHGPALVLLHGGAGSWRHWVRNIPVLALRYRVLAPDLPGMGESDAPPKPVMPGDVADMLAQSLPQALGDARTFDLAGFSYGGYMACWLAARVNERVRSLTIVGTNSWVSQPYTRIEMVPVRGLDRQAQWEGHRENLRRLMIADPARIDATALWIQAWNSRHVRVNSRKLYPHGSGDEMLRTLKIPLNGIWGERDAGIHPHAALREQMLRSLCPDVPLQFRLIEGAGHWASFEQPAEFNALLLEMLARTRP